MEAEHSKSATVPPQGVLREAPALAQSAVVPSEKLRTMALLLALGTAPLAAAAACAPAAHPRPEPTAGMPRGSATTSAAVPSPSPSEAPKPPPPRSRAGRGPIGTAGPVVLEAASPDAGWVVFCQARVDTNGDDEIAVRVGPHGALTGDRMDRYFAPSTGPEQRIDELAAHDPTGRWVIVRRDGRLLLIDTHSSRETDLDARGVDGRNDSLPFRRHRSVAFDGSGTMLAYLRHQDDRFDVVVRALSTGTETTLDPGPGEVWRVDLDFAGRFVLLSSLMDDTNRDKRLTWPAPEAKTPPPCRGPVTTYPVWVGRGDTPVTKLAAVTGGTAVAIPGFVTVLGAGSVVREPSGRLVLREEGRTTELASSQCKGRVVHADAARRSLVVACTGGKGKPRLELVGPGWRVELNAEVSAWPEDRMAEGPSRLVAIYPGSDAALVDLERRSMFALRSGDAVLATHEHRALVRRGKSLVAVDVTTGSEQVLEGSLTRTDAVARGGWVAIAPAVASAETGSKIGTFTGRPLSVSPDGHVLVARGGDADADRLALGPLVWLEPAAAAPADGGAPP